MISNRREESNGKTALVTGGATRVGRSIALELGRAGFDVAIHYHRNESGAREVVESLEAMGRTAYCLKGALEERERVRDLIDQVVVTSGGIDLLVPNAAVFESVDYDAIDDSAWDRMLTLNLSSTFALAHRATRSLRERQGNIVFITCSSVEAPYRHHLPYVVSKAGIYQAMRTMALELAPQVRVNAVAPGTVLPPENMSSDALQRLRRGIPLQRFGEPDDIARAVRFLAESEFVTGQQLVVDGGRSLALAPDGS